MTFLIDQQLPASLGDWFAARGHDAVHVRTLGMRDAPDSAIWRYALQNGLIVVTKDEDFAARRAKTDGPQVVWLRIGNATNRTLRAHLNAVWPGIQLSLEAGERIVEA